MDDADRHWLAGLLEGEGTFLKAPPGRPRQPVIGLQMTDEDVVARVAELLGVGYVKHVSSRNPAWKPSYFAHLQGQRAVRLMLELRPLMGERRKAQIDAAVATWAPRPSRISREQGEAIVGEFRAGRSAKSLAEAYGISKWSVYALHQGRYFGKSTEWRPSLPG